MRKVIIERPPVQRMEREFIETFEFRKRWKALKLDDDDLRVFQDTLCAESQVGDLIQGTGGVRKVRFEMQGRGKSRGARVVCGDFAVEEHLYLVSVFAKNEQGNLTAKQKREIKDFVKSL